LLGQLASARYIVAPLAGVDLGLTDVAHHIVRIDADAAGYGWFLDPTLPQEEVYTGSLPTQHMDLLTVVLHEMGHLSGQHDRPDDAGLMSELLIPGWRRTGDLDQVFIR
jgi:hypothetical protein